MRIIRDFMITPNNFKGLTQKQQQREIEKGFTYAIRRQIRLDQAFSTITNYYVMVDRYVKMVALNTKLRVYSQFFIQKDYPLTYQNLSQNLTITHFENYCADTLSVLEQLKRCDRQDTMLQMMHAALNDIISTQQDMFDSLKTGKQ